MLPIDEQIFGQADGQPVQLFTLKNSNGALAKISSYGALLTELHVPDRHGRLENVVLGFDNLEQYLAGHPFFGATTGRVANRIAHARFTLAGRVYELSANHGRHQLHGGFKGFDKRVWRAQVLPNRTDPTVQFTYISADGEEGFPGTLTTVVIYSWNEANELRIDYRATTDQPTPVNLTNHSYFNLASDGDILGHHLTLFADSYTVADSELIPTGQIAPVKGTPLDFSTPTPIGARIEQLKPAPGGYDHNFVVNRSSSGVTPVARAFEPGSGRLLEVRSTEPGVQLYTGNFLDGALHGFGRVYSRHSGFCLETQHFPDSVNQPSFPSTILRPGETYASTTVFKFSAVRE